MSTNGINSSLRRAFFPLRGGSRLQGFDDEQSARSFHLLLIFFLASVGTYLAVIVPFFAMRKAATASLLLVLGTGGLISLVLLRLGRTKTAGAVFVTFLWCVFGVTSLLRGGTPGSLLSSAASAAVLSAWLLGRAPTMWLLLATFLLGFIEAMMDYTGHRSQGYFPGEPFTVWAIGSGILLMTVAPVIFAVENLRRQISARREVEERQRLLAHALQSADCIKITDMEGRILFVNDAFLRTHGYEEEELIGRPIEIVLSSRTFPDAEYAAAAATKADAWRGEGLSRTKEGREFPVSVSTSVVQDERGRRIALVSIIHDLTEEKRVVADMARVQAQLNQANKMESIGRLAGGVAHDFNNLLTVIGGYAGLVLASLDRGPLPDPKVRDGMNQISRAASRAAGLTRQLLTFSRESASSPKTISLNELVLGIQEMLRRLIGERIQLIVSPGTEAGFIHADGGLVEQIIVNLTVNAADAMPEGGELFIETSHVRVDTAFDVQVLAAPPGNYVSLQITDTGTGMTPEVQARMFDPFFTTKEIGKGTGLGLSTVFGIVKQSGGYISFHSTVGLGTTFRVLFPMVAEEANPELPEPEIPSAEGTETILLVEDDPAVRAFIREVLEGQGYRVLDVEGGSQAIELAGRYGGRIDLLLTDVVLPGMNGEELIPRILVLRPGMPVLRMSGYPQRSGIQLKTGTPYLQKPFSPAELLNRIRTLF